MPGKQLPGQDNHRSARRAAALRSADCLVEGYAAGAAAAHAAGFTQPAGTAPRRLAPTPALGAMRALWVVPSTKPLGHEGKHFVDFQNDVTAADIALALREGYRSVEHLKRYTTMGMAPTRARPATSTRWRS